MAEIINPSDLIKLGALDPDTAAKASAAGLFGPGVSPEQIAQAQALSQGGAAPEGVQVAQNMTDVPQPVLPSPQSPGFTMGGMLPVDGLPNPQEAGANGSTIPQPQSPIQTTPPAQAPSPEQPKPEAGHIDISNLATAPKETPAQEPSVLKDFKEGHEKQLAGMNQGAEGQMKLAQDQSRILDQQMREQKASIAREEKFRQEQQNYSTAKLKEIEGDFEEVKKAHNIDPNRVWNSMSTGNKIRAGIALALGGIGASMTGGENPALKIINHAIDRDMEAQKMKAQGASASYQNKLNLYQMNMQRLGSPILAEQGERAMKLQIAQTMIQKALAQAGGTQAAAGLKQLGGQIQQQYTQQVMGLNVALQQQYALQQATSGGGIGTQAAAYLPKDMQEKAVPLPGGHLGVAYNSDSANKVKESSAVHDDIMNVIGKMRKLQEEAGRSLPYSEASEKGAALQSQLKPLLLKASGLSGLRHEAVEQVLEPQVVDPTAFKQGKVSMLLDTLEDQVRSSHGNLLSQHVIGYHPLKIRPNR